MSNLPALEAGAWVIAILCCSTTTVGEFDANLVAHEVAFVVLGNTLLCCFSAIKFLCECELMPQEG